MAKFDDLIDYSLDWEGGYSDHPDDKGGATKYGITIGRLSDHRGYNVSKDEVKDLSKQEALSIFRTDYWNKVQGDRIEDPGVALMMLDMAINHGPARAARYLQRCVGALVDSAVGQETLSKVNACEPSYIVEDLGERRQRLYERFVANNPSQQVFWNGWMNRHRSILAQARALVHSHTPEIPQATVPVPTPLHAPRAETPEISKPSTSMPRPEPKPDPRDPTLDGMFKGKRTITAAGVATVAATCGPMIPKDSEVLLSLIDRLVVVAVALVILFGFIKWLRIWRDKK